MGVVFSPVREACVHLHGLWVGDTVKYPHYPPARGAPPEEFERVRLIDSPNDLEAEGEVIGVRALPGGGSDRVMVQVRLLDDPRDYERERG